MSTFSIDQPFLNRILSDIGDGRIQLPDFQRDWVWDDYRIRSLIASVSQEFPIGSVLTLEADGTDIRFKPRLIEGVNPKDANRPPATFILDGQQRLTALFQTLMSENAVSTKNAQGRETRRYYYLDMEACISNKIEREEAVISCGEDHLLQIQTSDEKTKNIDLSSTKEQYANSMFPVHKVFDSTDWRQEYSRSWRDNDEKIELLYQFESKIIQCFNRYNVPVIELREIPREAVCLVFEKVNTRGVTLTVFELLTATFAASDFLLREDWDKRNARLKEYPVLEDIDSTNFLRALTLLATNDNLNAASASCTRRDILRLTVEDYNRWADQVESGFKEAAEFLNRRKIFAARNVPYQTQLVPLAATLAELGNQGKTIGSQKKIARWYWCGVFGEMYAGSTDTRAANDFSEVITWIRENTDEPTTIRDANFHANRLLELRTRGSAAYKGSYALLIARGCHDFLMEKTTEDMERGSKDIDIHHIFPRVWCQREKIEKEVYDSIINKTPLSARANRKIGGCAPSEYLPSIQEDAGINNAAMDEILASHLICANALRADDFWGFFEARKEALLKVIEKAMGKPVSREGEDLSDTES